MAVKANHKSKATHKETKDDTPEINISSAGHMKHAVEELRDEQEAQIPIPQPEAHPPLIRTEIVEARRPSRIWVVLVIILVAGLTMGGVWMLAQGGSFFTASPSEEVEEVVPTPTPSPEIVLSEYPIEIQNGSGISGEAAKLKAVLEAEKFVVSSVGNADNANHEMTIIKAKENVPEGFVDTLKKVLEKTYVVQTEKYLDDSETDVLVIIGKDTATASPEASLAPSNEVTPEASTE